MRALIAGAGDLPHAIATAADSPPLVAALKDFEPNHLTPDIVFRLEKLGTLLKDLRARGVTEVCLCGQITRPKVALSALDFATLRLLPTIIRGLRKRDDGALRAVIDVFEGAGFTMRAAHEIAPTLLPPEGVLTKAQPYAEAARDAALGDEVSIAQGAADLGQACVIRDGEVIAREPQSGTDAMLAALPEARDQREGLFYKAPKIGQDRRADLPVIGPQTIDAIARVGLAGLVLEADGVMILHRDDVIRACDAAGLFLWVRPK